MDPRERYEDPQEALRAALEGHTAGLWTALPGLVESFNATALTVSVQPAVRGVVTQKDGTSAFVSLPILPDVPVVFPRGGGCTLTFPIQPGDECLVVFSARNIDSWWSGGGVGNPLDSRRHDLSDGFALVGPFSQKTKITAVSTTTTQLRADDGKTIVDLDPKGETVSVTAPVKVLLTTPELHVTGSITCDSQIIAQGSIASASDVTAGGRMVATNDVFTGSVSLATHVHGGVQGGTGTTGLPEN